MMCDCISKVNRLLREHNTEIDAVSAWHPKGWIEERLLVPTRRIDSKRRKGPMKVFASFCPMCGKEIPKTEAFRSAETVSGGT